MSNSSIWPWDKTLSGATNPGQSGHESDGNEGVLNIPHNSSITEASPLDCLMSYLGHSLEESYPSTKMQLVYSWVPANRASYLELNFYFYWWIFSGKQRPTLARKKLNILKVLLHSKLRFINTLLRLKIELSVCFSRSLIGGRSGKQSCILFCGQSEAS